MLPLVEASPRSERRCRVDTRKSRRDARGDRRRGEHDQRCLAPCAPPGALEAVAAAAAPVAVCLMHMRGEPSTMQQDAAYDDVVAEVGAFLAARARACADAGIARERIVVDPGFGFGKTVAHNLDLLRRLPELVAARLPGAGRLVAQVDARRA